MLPLLSLAASASDLPVVSVPQTPTESLSSYPAVGLANWELKLATSAEPTNLTAEAIPIDAEAFVAIDNTDNSSLLEVQTEAQPAEVEENPTLGTMLVYLNAENGLRDASAAEDGFIKEAFEETFEPGRPFDSSVGSRAAGVPVLVKGMEDGHQARALEDWLIPFDDVIKALGFTATLQADGQLELQSSEVVTQIRLEDLAVDPELGSVWSVAEIENLFGASVEFDRSQYILQFNQPEPSQHISAQPKSDRDLVIDATFNGAYSAETVVDATIQSLEPEAKQPELGVMLVGLAVDSITTVEASLVKGREDGASAIAFDRWLIPFDDAMAALGGDITPQADGTLAIRIPGVATSIDPATLPVDPELGMTLSIADIESRFGISAEFDFSQYAIKFLPPLQSSSQYFNSGAPFGTEKTKTVTTAGLPTIEPAGFSFSAIQQETQIRSSSDRLLGSTNGQLSAMGSALGGSWYSRIEQPSVGDYSTWQLREFQYLRQTPDRDYVLGSQPSFWPAEGRQDYWGATAVQRWGFVPPTVDSRDGFSPNRRRQSHQIGRTVSGTADPGTLVQLTKGISGRVLAEVIVDSSGVYRFDDVPATEQLSGRFYSGGYKVQLFENGQLASEPEIRSAMFTTLPGQLPKGASALVASAGIGHSLEAKQILGNFNRFKGGLAYRRGVSESLTVGAGFVQDGTSQGLAELFYLPENVPLQAAVSARIDLQEGGATVNANVRYQPTETLRFAFNSDRFSQRFRTDWKMSPHVALIASGNTREGSLTAGIRASYRMNRWSGNAIATFDTNQNLRWNLRATNGSLALSNYGNEVSNYSNITYRPPRRAKQAERGQLGNEIVIAHERHRFSSTSSQRGGQLTTAQWRYRSPARIADGRSRWRYALGYGIGSKGSGPLASVSAALGAGLDLEMRYQSVSAFSDSNDFQISLVSRLNTQDGVSWGNRRQQRLRTQGGLLVQPFLDNNNNGIREKEEPLYVESPELLFQINREALSSYQTDIQDNGILMVLPPDTYRIDIDSAGLPMDRMTSGMAYAVEVSAGQYTRLPLPLNIAHTVSGVVIDKNGLAVPGARVEAVGLTGHRQISVTNSAGVYYLERLLPDTYHLIVDGALLEGDPLRLAEEQTPFHQKEIHLL